MSAPAATSGGGDNRDRLRKPLEVHKADTDGIVAQIVSLRGPSKALIRTMDNHHLEVKNDKGAGVFEVIEKYLRDGNAHVIQAAAKYHIPVAPVHAAFMGSNGDADPVDKGYVQGVDQLHPTEEGADLMAQPFRLLGYEYGPH